LPFGFALNRFGFSRGGLMIREAAVGCKPWLATHLYDLSGLELDQGLFYQRQ
jgi:hypothetical protein